MGLQIEGVRVLVVEDESLVALQLEDMLYDLGCHVVGPAMRIRAAGELLDSGAAIDCAVLDVNVCGEKVYPIAERLSEMGIPFIFATGYGRDGVDSRWTAVPILQKPYTSEQIGASLALCLQ
ncbi:response regulator [Jiella pelagia]|uniref:Response regulator n=1 Tax=Jiella pelagia TaxID=2986949 RepID=A0ABY7BY59_9HYPH|nr:response regulator [Jiella pelagia]WAP68357.1 response regulator [Jiella pelagia]